MRALPIFKYTCCRVVLLLEGDPEIGDNNGVTAIDKAKANGFTRLVLLMHERTARGRQRVLKTFRNAQRMLHAQTANTEISMATTSPLARRGSRNGSSAADMTVKLRELREAQQERERQARKAKEEEEAEEKRRQTELHAKVSGLVLKTSLLSCYHKQYAPVRLSFHIFATLFDRC